MDSGISEFTAHTVGLRYNGCYLNQNIDLHLDERTVPRAKNWTTVSSAFNLFAFLGGFLQIGTELRVVNSVNHKILSTNWPHDDGVNPSVETISISHTCG